MLAIQRNVWRASRVEDCVNYFFLEKFEKDFNSSKKGGKTMGGIIPSMKRLIKLCLGKSKRNKMGVAIIFSIIVLLFP